ncbi:hypothetical protein BH012_19665 [Salmonella enterica]|nr:hypothetical protein [Salmonella enterica]EAX6603514.1 hypothetical protein [Salmonella enterica]
MHNAIMNPINLADSFCKKYPQAIAGIEQVRMLKGKDIPDWPWWCFLPEKCWLILFAADRLDQPFTKSLLYELQQLSVLGTWRYSKGIYTPHPSLLQALTETPLSDTLPVDVLLRLPEWCIYIKTPGLVISGTPLYGFWAMIRMGNTAADKSLYLLLHGLNGLEIETFPLRSASVSAIQDDMFYDGLDSLDADPDVIETLKNSEHLSWLRKRKSDELSKLLSVLLYVCSDEPEIDSERQPGSYPVRPKPVKTKRGFRLFPANGPRYWSVGEQMGQALERAEAAMLDNETVDMTTGRHVRAHLRRGHWHGFWKGKMDGSEERRFTYHWLPPQIIGGRYT